MFMRKDYFRANRSNLTRNSSPSLVEKVGLPGSRNADSRNIGTYRCPSVTWLPKDYLAELEKKRYKSF